MESLTLYCCDIRNLINTSFGYLLIKSIPLGQMSYMRIMRPGNEYDKMYLVELETKTKIENIVKKIDAIFKAFVLSPSRLTEYDKCRSLKDVPRLDLLVEKFKEDETYKDIKASTNSLLNDIDERGHLYYAIAKDLTGSDLSVFPKELIGNIFHYVDGDIDLD